MTREPKTQALVQSAIARKYGLTATLEKITTEAIVLTAPAGPGAGLKPGGNILHSSIYIADNGLLRGKEGDLTAIATTMEYEFNKPVVDETGLTGPFSYELRWDRRQPATMLTSLQSQLGITAQKAQREVEVLVIRKR
jgi:uncharacterized protein (TIGR03435 family)